LHFVGRRPEAVPLGCVLFGGGEIRRAIKRDDDFVYAVFIVATGFPDTACRVWCTRSK